MSVNKDAMSDGAFFAYAHPYHKPRFYLALTFAILLFPLIAVGLVLGTIFMIVPIVAALIWLGARVLFARMVGNTILVSDLNYPRINAIAEDLKKKLGYEKPVYIFVFELGTFNAFMKYMFFRRAIFLTSELLESGVSDDEARWIIGRFVGYLRARRQAGVLGWIIRAAQHLLVFNLFLLPYERAMVYTGDRLAVAAINGDISSAISALQKLLVGRQLGYSVNPEGLIDQQRLVRGSFFAFLARLGSGFPHMTSRYVDLIVFAKAFFPAQFAKFEAANPGLPDDLARLGATPRSSIPPKAEGEEPVGRAPRGWVWAGSTLAIVILVGGLVGWSMRPPSYRSYDSYSSPSAYTPPTYVPPEPPTPQASPASTSPIPPSNTHYNDKGELTPDAGCRWVSSAANDFRVTCR